jgi:hypothetical protein
MFCFSLVALFLTFLGRERIVMQPSPFDPAQVALAILGAMGAVVNNFVNMLYQQVVKFAAGQQFVFQTGANVTFNQPLVIKMWQANVLAADVALALVLVWIGYNIILGLYQPLALLSRVVLAAIAVHASLTFIGLFIGLNNALCASAILTAGLPNLSDIAAVLGFHFNPNANGALVFQTLIILVMGLVVVLQLLVRVGLLDLLIVLSPWAMLLYASYATQRWANLWSAAFFATLFLQFLQTSAIALGAALIATIGQTFSLVSAFAGIAVLVFVLRIPMWLGSAVTASIGTVRSPFSYAASAAREVVGTALQFVP